jgi:hypothetical protein
VLWGSLITRKSSVKQKKEKGHRGDVERWRGVTLGGLPWSRNRQAAIVGQTVGRAFHGPSIRCLANRKERTRMVMIVSGPPSSYRAPYFILVVRYLVVTVPVGTTNSGARRR